jgi:glycosyltransferase involved in cell wall biosynthesis
MLVHPAPARNGGLASSVTPTVSVIVPARNEEASLRACLESIVAQDGIDFEVIVVNDGSTDRTLDIAESFTGVQVIRSSALKPGWSGKNNAAAAGASVARGEWLLFTDADTVHLPGSLSRAVAEAKVNGVALLSYSPEQEVHGFWESAVMPVIFAELASRFRPADVSDPTSSVAAANGQYLLITRSAYDSVGGHEAIASSLLEDVALARAVKSSGRAIFFRYGGDSVRTRMYRSFGQLREGWTKNLALLFPAPLWLATVRLFEFVLLSGNLLAGFYFWIQGDRISVYVVAGLFVGLYLSFRRRVSKAHFGWRSGLLALLGLPVFSYLLLRSRSSHRSGSVTWKERSYGTSAQSRPNSNFKE